MRLRQRRFRQGGTHEIKGENSFLTGPTVARVVPPTGDDGVDQGGDSSSHMREGEQIPNNHNDVVSSNKEACDSHSAVGAAPNSTKPYVIVTPLPSMDQASGLSDTPKFVGHPIIDPHP